MLSPIAFLIEHRKIILTQYRQNAGKAKKTWESLRKILPQLSGSMSFNTFKQYMSVLVVTTNGLDKVIRDRDEIIEQLKFVKAHLHERLDELMQRLDKLTQSRDNLLKDLKIITKQKAQLEEQVDGLKAGLDKVIHRGAIDAPVIHGLDKESKRICGWNVQKSKDGYYRCYRKIAKRLHCIYIGKELDLKKAQVRIAEKEKALR